MKTLFVALVVTLGLVGCAGMGGGPGSGSQTRSVGQAVDDAVIVTRMNAALAADPDLSAIKINVDSTKGAVRLRGEVKSLALRRKAEDLARRMDGVRSVDNQLVVTG
ncbi:BON domain-containing protein [Ramlibacter sp. AW1]|uniref:BON domain-containing protein n=1 Tax=Ramlibacter aurantiacus TaxID=2801330 RepID=A0A936ZX64_9BURK|nr:BON domain-containing protein [Ramlibacter aurantiacus]MBL0422159.1 BON domain-containing protein [Ramlibacter aurantiacus]